jgi:hypothetical protein
MTKINFHKIQPVIISKILIILKTNVLSRDSRLYIALNNHFLGKMNKARIALIFKFVLAVTYKGIVFPKNG